MGWDAFSDPFTARMRDADFDPLWKETAQRVRDEHGWVDGLLRFGGLDLTQSGVALAQATGESMYSERWSADQVITLAVSANWDFEFAEPHCKASARAFLERCVELGRGVRFSW